MQDTISVKMSDFLLVAAIDIGTVYSGLAYSTKAEFQKRASTINTRNWKDGSYVSATVPTCALIEPDGKTLDSFGYDAMAKYVDLKNKGVHREWYFFKRFKKQLFVKELQDIGRDTMIEDETGKKLQAMIVMTICIKYLKDDFIKLIQKRFQLEECEEILWVLTVPFMCSDASKQFMQEAAFEAGIKMKNLKLTLELEAAILSCRHLPVEGFKTYGLFLQPFAFREQFLVLDGDGDAVKTTICKEVTSGQVKVLHAYIAEDCGSTKADEAFIAFLSDIFGHSTLSYFKSKCFDDYRDLLREFRIKTKSVKSGRDGRIKIKMCNLQMCVEEISGQTPEQCIQQSRYAEKVKVLSDKIILDPSLFQSFLEPWLNRIINYVRNLLKNPLAPWVNTILLVGELADLPMLQERVKEFSKLKVIASPEYGLAVMQGAVIFGHSIKAPFLDVQDLQIDKFAEDELWQLRMKREDIKTKEKKAPLFDVQGPQNENSEDEIEQLRKELEKVKAEEKKIEEKVKQEIEKEKVKREIEERRRNIEQLKARHLKLQSSNLSESATGSDYLEETELLETVPDEVPGRKQTHRK